MTSRWLLVFTLAGLATTPLHAQARDLEDVFTDVGSQIGLSTDFDRNFLGYQFTLGSASQAQFSNLNEFSSNVTADRVIPVSSSVSGFTFEYNADLDVYERSTSTFGPLFTERAQTIGRGRTLVAFSATHLEFDEFEGEGLSHLAASSIEPLSLDVDPATIGFTTNAYDDLDILFDAELKQTVAAFQFTHGITDRIDVGVVVPLLRVDLRASAVPFLTTGAPLPACTPAGFGTTACTVSGGGGTSTESEEHTGFGDLIVRTKYHFLRSRVVDAAALLGATIPTGDPDNLTGFSTMTFRPGLVVSRDLTTDLGGLSFHGYTGWDVRPDSSNQDEIEWAAGAAVQPLRRASMSVDFLGSHKLGSADFGNNRFDASIGTKVMVREGLLADFNVIVPLNDDGLRSDAIFTAQFEYTFGD